jgi:hypothetical protein
MMWRMVPDIDVIGGLLANEDANWVSITFRGIGEMENSPVVSTLDPARSWIDLSPETDQWGMRRAYVNLVATPNDRQLWQAMDNAAFDLTPKLAAGTTRTSSIGMLPPAAGTTVPRKLTRMAAASGAILSARRTTKRAPCSWAILAIPLPI